MTARELLRDCALYFDRMADGENIRDPHGPRAASLRALADRLDAEMAKQQGNWSSCGGYVREILARLDADPALQKEPR